MQARVERVFLLQMLEQGYQTELLKKIDESLLAKVERLDPPLLLAYLDAHLNEERYYEDWQKIFFELGHISNAILPSTFIKLIAVEREARCLCGF